LGRLRAHRKKKRPLALGSCGLKGCWAGGRKEKEREREKEFPFSFKISFQFIFQTFKLQSNKNPCIRIMMHKHSLFLNYFSDV
jgi:hypothetical protein